MRRPEKNRAVLGHVMFWASIFNLSSDIFKGDNLFKIQRPVSLLANPCISDEEWIKIAKEEDKQTLVEDLKIEL